MRTQAYAFLNPYTDDIEYVVCTNSSAKSLHTSHDTVGAADPADTPVSYHQPGGGGGPGAPGLDYSMPSRREATPSSSIYNPHNLISHLPSQQPQQPSAAAAVVAANAAASAIQRPDSAHNPVQYSYNPTPSPIQYGSPGTPGGSGSLVHISKTNNTSPTPAATAWSLRQPQPVTEGYQYSELSPNRSPTGPTYTQLSATGSRQTSTYTPTSAQPGSGIWSSWQAHHPSAAPEPMQTNANSGSSSNSSAGTAPPHMQQQDIPPEHMQHHSAAAAAALQHQQHHGGHPGHPVHPGHGGHPGHPHHPHHSAVAAGHHPHQMHHHHPGHHPGQHPGQDHQLSDMLQMLDQSGATSFEDLNIHMFNTPFE